MYIGESKAGEKTGKSVIQINDATIDGGDLGLVARYLGNKINSMKEDDKKAMRIVLKVDSGDESSGRKGANMSVVNDVKKVLREIDALRIMYSADRAKTN